MNCPACGVDNMPGADDCTECRTPLTDEAFESKRGLLNDPIRKTGLRAPISVGPGTAVMTVLREMKAKSMGCALVVERGQLLGIFTERDALRTLGIAGTNPADIEISALMTPAPEILDEEDSVNLALNKMAMGNYRHVPIRKKDGTLTYFSVRDALRYLF